MRVAKEFPKLGVFPKERQRGLACLFGLELTKAAPQVASKVAQVLQRASGIVGFLHGHVIEKHWVVVQDLDGKGAYRFGGFLGPLLI